MKSRTLEKNRISDVLNGNHGEAKSLLITPPKLVEATFLIEGMSPLCINRFSQKAKEQMMEKQRQGSQAKKGKKRDPKDFDECYQQARHRSAEGWDGIAASAFRNAMISACRLVNFKMTLAKLSFFVVADGFDKDDSTPLVRIIKGEPRRVDALVKNETGVADIRPRPVWEPGWRMKVRVRFDADQFSLEDVTNLMARAGAQVGIGEGRADSKTSAGIGYGEFQIVNE